MKKNKFKEFFSNRGFYVALFTCTAVIVAIAIGVTMNNLDAVNNANQSSLKTGDAKVYDYETVAVGKSDEKELAATTPIPNITVTQPAKTANGGSVALNNSGSKTTNIPSVINNISETDEEPKNSSNSEIVTATEVANDMANEITKEEKEIIEITTVQEQETTPTAMPTTTAKLEDVPAETVATFSNFNADQKMSWPLIGDIVMDYSNERLVYDKTLDQYRTNSSICIAANVGTQVKATAEGIVESIVENKEKGTSVVIDHGNGWKTTYAQLQPNVLVQIGEVVKSGDVIGGVGNPSMYGILLGGHLDFAVAKDDIIYDPKTILE